MLSQVPSLPLPFAPFIILRLPSTLQLVPNDVYLYLVFSNGMTNRVPNLLKVHAVLSMLAVRLRIFQIASHNYSMVDLMITARYATLQSPLCSRLLILVGRLVLLP
ncbi:hypothetical protein L209DRAFT_338894 [Thermothelomyces heterothallicus CBS 203.75]